MDIGLKRQIEQLDGPSTAWRKIANRARDKIKRTFKTRIPMHRDEGFSPFFIVGSGRCGTTLLRRILEADPTVHIPPENWVFRHWVQTYRNGSRVLSWNDLVNLVLSIFEYEVQFETWFKESLRPLATQLRGISPRERSLAHIIDQLYRYHGKTVGKAVSHWGDKTPANVYSLQEVIAVFPEARFIELVRNGLDVIPSMILARGMADHLVVAAKRWKTAVVCAGRFARQYPAQCLQIRYEDLVEEPSKTTQSICAFLGLNYSSEMLTSLDHVSTMRDIQLWPHLQKAGQRIDTQSIGKGSASLTEEQRKTIIALVGNEMAELGYTM